MSEIVTIREVKHPRYTHRASFKQGGRYIQRYFCGKANADAFAKKKRIELLNEGRKHGEITDDERRAIIRARGIAAELEAVGEKFTVGNAIDFYAEYLRTCRQSATVQKAYNEFMDDKEREKIGARHLSDLTSRLRPFLAAFGKRLVAQLTSEDIQRWLFALPVADQTRINYKLRVGNFLNYCIRRKWREGNPLDAVAKIKVESEAPGILTVSQTASLLTKCSSDILPVVAIGLFCGLRSAELAKLDWSEINLSRGFIEVKATKAKSKKRRLVTIPPNLKAWLKPLALSSGPVALSDMKHRTRFDTAKTAAKITEWPANALRHSFASYHYALHQDAAKTAAQLGHSDTDILFEHYRELVTPADAKKFFAIKPAVKPGVKPAAKRGKKPVAKPAKQPVNVISINAA
jgi:integrase